MPREVDSLLRPSGAHRWMACPASPLLESEYDYTTSKYAAEGSAAHWLAEQCLNSNSSPKIYVGQTREFDGFTVEITADMADHVQKYIDYIEELGGDVAYYELELDLSAYLPNKGTTDAAKADFSRKHADIVDLKFGKGVMVYAEGNPQMKTYALGALEFFEVLGDIETVTVHIVQPRLNHIDTFTYYSDELLAFGNELIEAVDKVRAVRDATAYENSVAGDHCKFCAAKASCRRFHEQAAKTVAESFDDLSNFEVADDVAHVTGEELAHMLENLPLVKSWVTTVEEHAFGQLQRGEKIPGWKLVEGRSHRKWGCDEDDVLAALKSQRKLKVDEYAPRKVLSLAQLESLMGKTTFAEKLGDLVVKPTGKPALAPESDKRPAIAAVDQFDDVSGEAA